MEYTECFFVKTTTKQETTMLWNQMMGAVMSRRARVGERLTLDISNTGLHMFRRKFDLVCYPTRVQMGQRITIKGIPICIQHKLKIGSMIKGIYLEDIEGESDLLYLMEPKYNGKIIDLDGFCSCDRPSCESTSHVHAIFTEMDVIVGETLPDHELQALADNLTFLMDEEYPVRAEFTPF